VSRFEVGKRSNRAAISRDYYRKVVEDFSAIGAAALTAFKQLTDPPPCPVLDLRRVEVPALPEVQTPSAARDN
jgi:hypothetical protein